MNILVTGGAGFIGSHIADALKADGNTVTILDDLRMGQDNIGAGIVHCHAALEDLIGDNADEIENLSEKGYLTKFDRIVHCAARADVALNWENERERDDLFESNIVGTRNLLETYPNVPITFLSTCAVYGDNEDCQEDQAVIATSPYAASKIAGEAMIQSFAYKHNIPWHVFRLSCAFGSRYHHGHIRDFVDQAETGSIHPANDGWAKKSAVHVLDVVQAVRLAVLGDMPSGIYNLASGVWSPRDTIRVMGVEHLTEWPENKKHGWVGDPMAIASGNRARSMGWSPQHSLEKGVREALKDLGFSGT